MSLDSVLGALVSRVVSTSDMYLWMKLPHALLDGGEDERDYQRSSKRD